MSWPWAKRHPMPEPAEFIRQNTTTLNPDIESSTPSPATDEEIREKFR